MNTYITNKINIHKLKIEDEKVIKEIITYANNLIYNIFNNSVKILDVLKRKTITIEILKSISLIQKKSIGKFPETMKGGRVLFPSEYFGVESNSYSTDVDFTQSFSISDYAKAGLDSTVGVVEQTNEIQETQVMQGGATEEFYLKKELLLYLIEYFKKEFKVRIKEEIKEFLFLSVDVNLHALFKDYTKKYKSKTLTLKNLKNFVKNNKNYTHFNI